MPHTENGKRKFAVKKATKIAEIIETSPEDREISFIPKRMITPIFPLRKQKTSRYTKKHGKVSVTITAGVVNGKVRNVPYGVAPRLITNFIATELQKPKYDGQDEPVIALADTLNEGLRLLGVPTGGKFYYTVREAFIDYFSAVVQSTDETGASFNSFTAKSFRLWWDDKSPDQAEMFPNYVQLDKDFAKMLRNSFPVDANVIRAIKNSAIMLDLYSIISLKSFLAYKTGKDVSISARDLRSILSTSNGRLGDFTKGTLRPCIEKLQLCCPQFDFEYEQGCNSYPKGDNRRYGRLVIHSAGLHIPEKTKAIE